MKKLLIPFYLWMICFLMGCFDDEKIYADIESPKRIYDTLSTNPVFKYVSRYYYKYNKFLITDLDTADYLFNFQYKNKVYLVQPNQDQANLLKTLTFMEKMFLNGYSDEMKKEFFPNAILLADTIKNLATNSSNPSDVYPDMYVTKYHISFLVREDIMNKNEQEKQKISRAWNYKFLTEFCTQYKNFIVPEEFYMYSTDKEFADNSRYPGNLTEEQLYELGYVYGSYNEWWDWTDVAYSKAGYLEKYLNFLLTKSPDEIVEIIAKYPKVKKPHDVLDGALKELGIDYRIIGYRIKE